MSVQIPNAARVVRIFYGAVLAGLVIIGATVALLRRFASGPSLVQIPGIGIAFAVLALTSVAVAVRVLRPGFPERRPDQSADLYWSDAGNRGRAIVLWAVVDGAGVLGAVGYLLTGSLAAVGALGVALAAMMLLQPARLEGEGAA